MDTTPEARFYFSNQLLRSTGGLGILPHHHQDKLRHEALTSFSYPELPEPCLLFQCDQKDARKRSVGGPGGPHIPYPLHEVC